MPPLPPFADVGEAYDAALALLTDSLAETHAAGGTEGLPPQDRLLLDVLHAELVRTCAALINKGWRSCPVSREALIVWSRHATEAREVLAGVAPAPGPEPSADARIEADRSRKVPGRLLRSDSLQAPVLGARRTLTSLLGGLPHRQLDEVCASLLGGRPPKKAAAVALLRDAMLGDDALLRALSGLSGDAYALLQRVVAAGGEVPLARLSLGWGPPWQHSVRMPVTPLALLQSRGMVFVGWDNALQDVLVVVPAELRSPLAPTPWRRAVAPPALVELHVELAELEPPVWRRIQLSGDASLFDLHCAIQAAFGWRNMHLHSFRDADDPWTVDDAFFAALDEDDPAVAGERERFVVDALPEVGARLVYWYDFGDDWVHRIERVAASSSCIAGPRRLVGGAGVGPPEDCGGAPGYARCVAVATGRARDPGLKRWLRGWHPGSFDLKTAQRRFHR